MPNYNPGGTVGSSSRASQRQSKTAEKSVANTLGSALSSGVGAVSNIARGFGSNLVDEITDSFGLGKLLRSSNIPLFGMSKGVGFSEASWGSKSPEDWRVRLSIPANFNLGQGVLQKKLTDTNGMVFPYTPQIILQHSANYGSMRPTHSNYPFPVYQNSQADTISITGDFLVENADEATYWIAAVHYLRSVTKMSYGIDTTNQGSPPPVVKLNGYGDFVLKNVPVVVNLFSVDLPSDVDYIHVPGIGPEGTWVPTRSQIAIQVTPTYSRRSVQSFSLDKFIAGGYANGSGVGFI